MIPWGRWHPDIAGVNTPAVVTANNCLPSAKGFKPQASLVGGTAALPGTCRGAAAVLLDDGTVMNFATDSSKIFRLTTGTGAWADVSGATYAVSGGEQWKFDLFGNLLIGVSIQNNPQKFDVAGAGPFTNLGGSPPRARYIAIVRDFVVLGAILNNEKRVQWCSINNAEAWVSGVSQADDQDLPNGGPVRGLIGGEVGYIFQADRITRMTYAPGSLAIFQLDQVEGAAGLAAPHSLVRLRTQAYYLASDGIVRFNLGSGASEPLGIGKWAAAFMEDKRPGTDLSVIGAIDPVQRVVRFAYVSKSSGSRSDTPDKQLIYDWSIDEATTCDISTEAMASWVTQGVTLDTMNSYGTIDELPFSLDSPFWRGGAKGLGIFSTDHKLSYESGAPRAATFETADGMQPTRQLVTGTRPSVDTADVTVAIAPRERQGDAVTYQPSEPMEDTGVCPAHASGRLFRARLTVNAGARWTVAQGLDTVARRQGNR